MGSPRRLAAPLLACALALSACSGGTAEDRINAALPPGTGLLAARDAVVALDPGGDAGADFEREYQAQLKVRALKCGHGLAPSAFDSAEAIRAKLGDKDCFVAFDRELGEWLGQRRIGRLLAAPPLRPLPAKAPRLLQADAFITEVAFAERAGIAIVQSSDHYQVLDIATGESLGSGVNDGSPSLSPSPNGRMFVTSHGGVALVRDSETGALLARYPGVHPWEFHWVGDSGAVFRPARDGRDGGGPAQAVFVDFNSGTQSPLAFGSGGIDRVLPRFGKPDQYLLIGSGRLGEMVLERAGGLVRARLVGESALGGHGFARNTSGLTADGLGFFGVAQDLQLVRLDSLDALTIPFLPMRLQGATATADPDRLLLTGLFPQLRRGYETFVYSIRDRTLAPVDRQALLGGRVVYIPSLQANAVIEEAKLVMLDAIPAGAPVPVDDFIAQREAEGAAFTAANAQAVEPVATTVPMMQDSGDMVGARMLEKMQRENPNMDLSGARRLHHISDELWARATRANDLELQQQASLASTVKPYPGAVAELGRTATVEAVGVYEAADGKRDPSREGNRYGSVVVRVGHTSRPMILVLASYDPVRWVLSVQPGAKLGAVLTAGYYPQEVIGAGDARVYKIGRLHAYKRDGSEFHALNAEVARWSGKPIDVFQGEYSGTSFSVGN
jgi:hypothetical protein